MKNILWITVSAALGALVVGPIACGGGGGGTGGSGEGGSSSNASSSKAVSATHGSTSSSAMSSSSGMPADCTGILTADDCGTCSEDMCCQELADCKDIPGCVECLTGDSASCTADTADAAQAVADCQSSACEQECIKDTCNPVTSAECTNAGTACDLSSDGVFVCFAPPNDTALCVACNNGAGPWCVPGLHCGPGDLCYHYCCDDGDCGTGTCSFDELGDPAFTVGLCVAAGDGGSVAPACDAPATAPSAGSCFMLN